MKSLFSTLLLALVLWAIPSGARSKDDLALQIDSLLRVKSPRGFNGVVYIRQNGQTIYAKASGYADFKRKTPLRVTDGFSTMSIAKQVTATLVLQQVEKGTVDLHSPIRKYLPDLPYSWADTITVHQLLNNSSGLDSDDLDKPLKFRPGSGFNYSNIGYSLLGRILERQSHKTYGDLVNALFKRCGMTHSYYPRPATQHFLKKGHTLHADGSITQQEKIPFDPALCPGSHLIVTAIDLASWNEQLHQGRLLQPATYKLMTTYSITAAHPLFGDQPIGYGYGLRINDKTPIREIGHTGFHPVAGYTAVNLYYPDSKTSVIVLENQAHEDFSIAYYFEQAVRTLVITSGLLP